VNFGEWAQHVLENLHQANLRNPDSTLASLLDELERYAPERVVTPDHLGFSVPVRLRSAHGELRLLTTITTFATAVDVTVAELSIEAFFLADEVTSDFVRSWADEAL
jgi:hypothetical protein